MRNHEQLIDRLSASAQPVRRTWPTGWRVIAWIAVALPCGALSSWALHSGFTDWQQPGAPAAAVALLFSLIIGCSAIACAFTLSLAGRQPLRFRWAMILAVIWLGLNLFNMSFTMVPAAKTRLWGEGIHCYLFMLCASVPMVVLALISLRRTRSLNPGKSLALAGCGIAFMSSALLSLCHDTHLHIIDFSMHLAAGITIIVLTVVSGKRWIGLSAR